MFFNHFKIQIGIITFFSLASIVWADCPDLAGTYSCVGSQVAPSQTMVITQSTNEKDVTIYVFKDFNHVYVGEIHLRPLEAKRVLLLMVKCVLLILIVSEEA